MLYLLQECSRVQAALLYYACQWLKHAFWSHHVVPVMGQVQGMDAIGLLDANVCRHVGKPLKCSWLIWYRRATGSTHALQSNLHCFIQLVCIAAGLQDCVVGYCVWCYLHVTGLHDL